MLCFFSCSYLPWVVFQRKSYLGYIGIHGHPVIFKKENMVLRILDLGPLIDFERNVMKCVNVEQPQILHHRKLPTHIISQVT